MAYLYADAERDFAKRRKMAEFKTLWRDVRMYQEADGSFRFTMFTDWHRKNEVPLATLTPDNVYTIVFKQGNPGHYGVFPTVCNRVDKLLGLAMSSCRQRYGNYESWIRIWRDGESLPYHPGIQFQVFASGNRWATRARQPKCLNPQPDRKQVLKNDVVQEAKRGTDKLRKLVNTCVKLRSFDDALATSMGLAGRTSITGLAVPSVSSIDLDNPQFEDALATVLLGAQSATRPSMYTWVGGRYTNRSVDDILLEFSKKAASKGLEIVRTRRFYATDTASEVVVVPRASEKPDEVPAEAA